jgi:hypothetical protein
MIPERAAIKKMKHGRYRQKYYFNTAQMSKEE